ncbi:MAG: hypothetical protein LBB61_07495 [Treponema sp.]|nr:hypothetical protein [Treponema sp.]
MGIAYTYRTSALFRLYLASPTAKLPDISAKAVFTKIERRGIISAGMNGVIYAAVFD